MAQRYDESEARMGHDRVSDLATDQVTITDNKQSDLLSMQLGSDQDIDV